MNEFADRLHGEGHFESGEIQRRKQAVLERRSRVKGAAVERRNKLEDCRKLMVFLQNVMEVSAWACKPAPTGFTQGKVCYDTYMYINQKVVSGQTII